LLTSTHGPSKLPEPGCGAEQGGGARVKLRGRHGCRGPLHIQVRVTSWRRGRFPCSLMLPRLLTIVSRNLLINESNKPMTLRSYVSITAAAAG